MAKMPRQVIRERAPTTESPQEAKPKAKAKPPAKPMNRAQYAAAQVVIQTTILPAALAAHHKAGGTPLTGECFIGGYGWGDVRIKLYFCKVSPHCPGDKLTNLVEGHIILARAIITQVAGSQGMMIDRGEIWAEDNKVTALLVPINPKGQVLPIPVHTKARPYQAGEVPGVKAEVIADAEAEDPSPDDSDDTPNQLPAA